MQQIHHVGGLEIGGVCHSASHQQVSVSSKNRHRVKDEMQWIGIAECQRCWLSSSGLSVVYGQHIVAVACVVAGPEIAVDSYEVGALTLTVSDDIREVSYPAQLTLHRNGADGGQQRELSVLHLHYSHLAALILHRYQIGIDTFLFIANETFVAE